MSVVMYLGITIVCSSLSIIGSMASKRVGSKDIVKSTTGDAVEKVSMSFPIYEDTNFFIDNYIKIK